MQEEKAPDFFKYLDKNGKMKANAPESAKKAFQDWKNDNTMKISIQEAKETEKQKMTEPKTINAIDVETDYIPKHIRKEFKLGEYAEPVKVDDTETD